MSEPNVARIMAGKTAVIAHRYARSLYELAVEHKALDSTVVDVENIRASMRASVGFLRMAGHPRLTRKQLVEAMEKASDIMQVTPLVRKFLSVVAQHRRVSHLSEIVNAFFSLVQKNHGEVTAEIASTGALTSAQLDQLVEKLSAMMGKKIEILAKEDASLLGGMTVKMGSCLIDASIKGKLARIERQLKAQREAA